MINYSVHSIFTFELPLHIVHCLMHTPSYYISACVFFRHFLDNSSISARYFN